MTHLLEQDAGMKPLEFTSPVHADEWLGPESHVPNMGRELRRRNQQSWDTTGMVVGGALFAAGVALGSLAAMWMTRSRRSE